MRITSLDIHLLPRILTSSVNRDSAFRHVTIGLTLGKTCRMIAPSVDTLDQLLREYAYLQQAAEYYE